MKLHSIDAVALEPIAPGVRGVMATTVACGGDYGRNLGETYDATGLDWPRPSPGPREHR
jgi:hypothetical protein